MYKKIVMAYDGTETGKNALLDCNEIARLAHSDVYLIAVVPASMEIASGEATVDMTAYDLEERQRYRDILEDGLVRLEKLGYTARGEIGYGDPILEIAKYASLVGADLVVVGHKHREGWSRRWWHRSVAKSLIETSPCSVLIAICH